MITLHYKRGVNPHLTFCPRCGGDSPDLMLIGNRTAIHECTSCKTVTYGGISSREKCQKCGTYGPGRHIGTIQEGQKLPGSLCPNCEKEVKEHAAVVKAGGVYFRCLECKATGVIKPESEQAKELCKVVRAKLNVAEGEPCGIEMSHCREHGGGK